MSDEVAGVNVRPGVGMLALFPSMNYKAWYAMGEFIDNALQSFLQHEEALQAQYAGTYKLRIEITLDRTHQRIVVKDNAAGIYAQDITRAFTPAVPPADASGLSQFGIGMKSAGCWYAKRFTISSTALGEGDRRTVDFDIPAMVETNREVLPVTVSPAASSEHGTTLVLTDLNHGVPTGSTLSKIRRYLASIYRGFLGRSDVEIIVAEQRLKATTPAVLLEPRWDDPNGPVLTWRKSVHVTLPSGRVIEGWAALREKGSSKESGLALVYRGKVVQGAGALADSPEDTYRPREIFGTGNTYANLRLFGELDVSEIGVTYSKDALLWAEGDEEGFIEALREQLDSEPLPLLRMANHHRTTERGRAAQRAVEQSVSMVAEATALASRELGVSGASLFQPAIPLEEFASSRAESSPVAVEIPLQRSTAHEYDGDRLSLTVVDEPSEARWLRLTRNVMTHEVTVNRAHPFMESFAHAQGADLEPLLRMAMAVSIAEIRADAGGVPDAWFFREQLNALLRGPLAERVVGE